MGMLVYMFNTYFLTSQTGHLTLMAAYAIAPAVVYSFQQALDKKKIVWGVIAGLLFSLCSAYEPRAAYIVLVVLALYFLYFTATLDKKNFNVRYLLNVIFFAAVPIILFALINFYWVFGLVHLGEISSNALFSRELYGSELFSILYSLTIYHPFWTGTTIKVYATQRIIFYFWI